VNEIEKTILMVEVKINPKKISLQKLKEKPVKLIQKFSNYKIEFKGFSLNDL